MRPPLGVSVNAEAFLELAGGLERSMASYKHFFFDAEDLRCRFRGLKWPERRPMAVLRLSKAECAPPKELW